MDKEIKYQLVPPHQHRRNPAERAIRTFKNHFIAGLCSTDENFPLQCWCRLLDQAELIINMLRPSRLNPRLSAYAQLEGSFNFNATPLAPPGTKVVVHETPAARKSWAPHGIEGWYVGPAMKHYRCFRCFIPKTGSERIAETVQFFPQQVRMPSTSSQDAAIKAIHDLTHAIKHPTAATLTLLLGDEKTHALETLVIFSNSAISQLVPSRVKGTILQEPRVVDTNNTIILSQPRVQLKLNHPIENKTQAIPTTEPINTPNIVTKQLSDNITSPRLTKTPLRVPNIILPTKSPIHPTNIPNVSLIHIIPPDTFTLPKNINHHLQKCKTFA